GRAAEAVDTARCHPLGSWGSEPIVAAHRPGRAVSGDPQSMKRAVIAAVVTAVALLLVGPAAVMAAGAKPPTKITRDLAALPAQHTAARAAGIPLAVP